MIEEQDQQLDEIGDVRCHSSLPLDCQETPLSCGGHQRRDQQANQAGQEAQHRDGQDSG